MDDPNKPSILSEYSKPSVNNKAVVVYLEDESGRVCINCDNITLPLLNGSVVGLHGKQVGSTFFPSECFYAGIPPQKPSTFSGTPCRIVLISDIDGTSPEWDRCVEMLLNNFCESVPFLVQQTFVF